MNAEHTFADAPACGHMFEGEFVVLEPKLLETLYRVAFRFLLGRYAEL